jgi:adenylate kinase
MKKYFSEQAKKQVVILMLGAPGVGKGTYSKMLSKDMKVPEFSTGDLLRRLTKDQSNPLAQRIQAIINKGELLDDNFTNELVKDELNKPEYKNGVILDGFPRNTNQCELFESYKHIDLVLNIKLNEDILIRKLLGRRVCHNCEKSYNICEIKENGYDMEPLMPKKNPNKCDDCGGDLEIRDDDKENVIKDRINLYKKKTQVLEDYFTQKGVLESLELKRGIKDYPLLKDVVIQKLKIKF